MQHDSGGGAHHHHGDHGRHDPQGHDHDHFASTRHFDFRFPYDSQDAGHYHLPGGDFYSLLGGTANTISASTFQPADPHRFISPQASVFGASSLFGAGGEHFLASTANETLSSSAARPSGSILHGSNDFAALVKGHTIHFSAEVIPVTLDPPKFVEIDQGSTYGSVSLSHDVKITFIDINRRHP
jgi:hypothetical protein